MVPIAHKSEIAPLDGTPIKRMFWSIISDYGLQTGISELIDNAIDLWMRAPGRPLRINLLLDPERQIILVEDNAGGVKKDELRMLVTPGGSLNDPDAQTIGIFGVGGKRASIALGEHVEIRTRYKREQSYELDITKEWLDVEDWQMPVYEVSSIAQGTTSVSITQSRKPFTEIDVEEIKQHLQETYGWFLHQKCTLYVNGTSCSGVISTFGHTPEVTRHKPQPSLCG